MFMLQVTEDISLKLVGQKDAEELFAVVNGSREHLREWLPWVDSMTEADQYGPIIHSWLQQFADEDGFQAGIMYKGHLAGFAGFHTVNYTNRQTSIGYWLAQDYQGKGIMTAVVSSLVDYAFEEYDLHRVEIRCATGNIRSQAIPERLGFMKEGVIRDGEFLYDHYHDLIVYGMLEDEWKKCEKS
ncbi:MULTISPECIES: GNAT family N-acetyltransferase [unclassified Sporosarcina]|uniref:GNAT family N-acetyltransferase n=1 Tax=unclassified Sporosarcina TaxID=2647733 RepID=UPI000C16DD64|nr:MULTISPECIES: GNAT family protein [unclassified Sporosarcina]PIC99119.1 RimJ/RimL family protein N-acetyltransferase [Sporosarcina sp. P29]PID05585.1 RimJ/RimL family protein N-acetyltransferase [Sporosarcina sp. P30]PID08779.1 RimJ/RimL family protein N-acetyltransferase [Sporosarcina sp. P31]PID11951.1 RimJ/RimL family protein N-acetyltransferase [Sporosarcina sp. P32b]